MRRNSRQDALNRLREQQEPRRMVGRQMYRGNQRVDPFFDSWERDFDRTAKRGMKAFIAVWVGILIANLIIWGVVIWAIVQLVQWVQTK